MAGVILATSSNIKIRIFFLIALTILITTAKLSRKKAASKKKRSKNIFLMISYKILNMRYLRYLNNNIRV